MSTVLHQVLYAQVSYPNQYHIEYYQKKEGGVSEKKCKERYLTFQYIENALSSGQTLVMASTPLSETL